MPLQLCFDKEHNKGMHVQFEVSIPNTYPRMTRYFFLFNSSLPKLTFLTSSAPNY